MIDDTILVSEAPFYAYPCEVEEVVDGDTIDVMIDLGFNTFTSERLRARNIDTREIHFVDEDSEEYSMGIKHTRTVRQWVEEARTRSNEEPPFVLLSERFQRGSYGRVIGDVWSRHHEEFWTEMLLDEYGDTIRYRE